MPDPNISVASRFAAALDVEDYDALHALLSEDCEYVTRHGATLVGVAPIVESYSRAAAWVRENIETVAYESFVRLTNGRTAIVTFVDHLEHAGVRHTYSCEQELQFKADGRICRITHREIRGEREAADVFLLQIGVTRASPGNQRGGA